MTRRTVFAGTQDFQQLRMKTCQNTFVSIIMIKQKLIGERSWNICSDTRPSIVITNRSMPKHLRPYNQDFEEELSSMRSGHRLRRDIGYFTILRKGNMPKHGRNYKNDWQKSKPDLKTLFRYWYTATFTSTNENMIQHVNSSQIKLNINQNEIERSWQGAPSLRGRWTIHS